MATLIPTCALSRPLGDITDVGFSGSQNGERDIFFAQAAPGRDERVGNMCGLL